MLRHESGYWFAKMKLPPGTYQFKYFADNEWYIDYAAFGLDHNSFGLNSVVRVPYRILQEEISGRNKNHGNKI